MGPDFPKIVVTAQSFSRDAFLRALLEEKFPSSVFNERRTAHTAETLQIALVDADAAIVGRDRIDESILSECNRLQVIAKYGVGLDNIDRKACSMNNVRVMWTPGVNRLSVAEQTLGFMLALRRNLFRSSVHLREGEWWKHGGGQLTATTVGIIGVGSIGKELVRLLKPFNCRILVNDIFDQTEYYKEHQLIESDKDQLLTESDIVTIHTPLDDSTRHLINRTTLRTMKNSAVLINTARGGIVNEQALKEALANGVIAGAALDVYEKEPLTDGELYRLPNMICTPHIGGNSIEAVRAMGAAAIANLELHFNKGDGE